MNGVLLSAFGVWPVLAWVYLERFCRKGHLWEFHFGAHEGLQGTAASGSCGILESTAKQGVVSFS